MAESMINRIALLYKKAKSSAWGRTFKSDSERNYYIAEYLVKNDVVEVVRCKDCKHFRRYTHKSRGECGLFSELNSSMQITDYCSYGERRCEE